jgi:hypothetical protein
MKILMFLMMTLTPLPSLAQQSTTYQVCTEYQENYYPGYVDNQGNYIAGNVSSRINNVQCGSSGSSGSSGFTQQGHRYGVNCAAATSTLGGLLGGGLAAVISKPDSYGWSIPLGAVLGVGVAQSSCN